MKLFTAICAILTIVFSVVEGARLAIASQLQAETVGTVTEIYEKTDRAIMGNMRGLADYNFTVDSVQYSGREYVEDLKVRKGDFITVRYMKDNPYTNWVRDESRDLYDSAKAAILLLFCLLALFPLKAHGPELLRAYREGWVLAFKGFGAAGRVSATTVSQGPRFLRTHIGSVLVACAILIGVAMVALSNRYVHTAGGHVLDKWTGTFKRPQYSK